MNPENGEAIEVSPDSRSLASELQSRSVLLFVTLASIGDAVISTDGAGSITFLNPMAEKLTGWSLEEAIGMDAERVFKVIDENTGAAIPSPIQEAIKRVSKVDLPSDTILVRKDGSVLPIDDSSAPILDMDTNVLGAVLVFRDITERKRAEREIKYRSELDRMAARISTAFMTSPVQNVDTHIDAALKSIGEFLGADRSYVFLYSRDGSTLSCTHEWCADGVQPFREENQNVPVSRLPHWTEKLRNRQYVYVSSPEDIPQEALEERTLWEQWDVSTLIAVPMSQEDKVLGFMGVDSIRQPRPWPEEIIDLLYLIGNVFAGAMARRDAIRKLEIAREKEVQIGSTIQRTLLLGEPPSTFADFHVAALTIPSRRIDGDFYDFILHPNRCLDIIFGDVMGKGVPAALLAAGSKTEFLRSLTHLLTGSARGTIPQPQDIVNSVHSVLTPQLVNLDSFVTLSYVRFDPIKKIVMLVDCGNTRLMRYVAQEGTIEHLSGHNLPLGFSPSEEYIQAEFSYTDEDIFILYSDGVTEARSPDGRMFGTQRLRDIVVENCNFTPQMLVQAIKNELMQFIGYGALADDFTCVVIKIITEENHGELPMNDELLVPSSLSELSIIREFLRGFCQQRENCSLTDKEIHLLELAVNEVASNIIKHAYHGQVDKLVWVRINLTTNDLRVRLLHTGDPFVDRDRVPPPAFDGSREGGFGLFIINHTVDAIDYGVESDGRQYIELTKRLGTSGG